MLAAAPRQERARRGCGGAGNLGRLGSIAPLTPRARARDPCNIALAQATLPQQPLKS